MMSHCLVDLYMFSCYNCLSVTFFHQVSLLLSKISPKIVGEALQVNRLYDTVNCLLSWQVFLISIGWSYKSIYEFNTSQICFLNWQGTSV
jgi:hypothetical protein